jgi:hypothetical protein
MSKTVTVLIDRSQIAEVSCRPCTWLVFSSEFHAVIKRVFNVAIFIYRASQRWSSMCHSSSAAQGLNLSFFYINHVYGVGAVANNIHCCSSSSSWLRVGNGRFRLVARRKALIRLCQTGSIDVSPRSPRPSKPAKRSLLLIWVNL